MLSFRRSGNPHMLVIGMTGVKMGDRLLQIGCADAAALAAVAGKVGLSGRARAVVPDAGAAARVRRAAERQGVLVEADIGPATALPADSADYDIVVIDDRTSQFAADAPESRAAIAGEALRVLKPGGRALVISALPATGLNALLGRGPATAFDASATLQTAGFRFVRLLGEREGLRFVEGTKGRTE